jgi:hypothetical protein
MTTAETMESLASSGFFAGVPHVDWDDSTDVLPNSLNSIGTTVPMADPVSYTDPYGDDAYDGQAEDILNKLGNMPTRCLKDPLSCSDYVHTEHLGQEYSCDPSPFHERDVDIAAVRSFEL